MARLALIGFIFLAACAGPGDKVGDLAERADEAEEEGLACAWLADLLITVPGDLRPLRYCLLVAGVANVARADAEMSGVDRASEFLGRVERLNGSVARVRDADQHWRETDMAMGCFTIMEVMSEAGTSRALDYLVTGGNVRGIIGEVGRSGVRGYTAAASIVDSREIMRKVTAEPEELDPEEADGICQRRIDEQVRRLRDLSGALADPLP